MQWLLKNLLSLEHVRLNDLSRVHFALLAWEGWPLVLKLIAVVAILALMVFGFWSYMAQSAGPAKRIIAGLLRAAALGLIFFLFMRPALVLDEDVRTPSIVAVWIDESASMSMPDPYKDPAMRAMVEQATLQRDKTDAAAPTRANRYDLALSSLRNKDSWIHKLAEKQHVAIFTGGPHAVLVGVAQSPDQVDALLDKLKNRKPDQPNTDVPVAISDMFRQLQGQPISAAVVMTDGRSTEGTAPTIATNVALAHRTPIFALPLGQDSEPLNVAVATPIVPENTFVKDPVVVKVKLHVGGIDRPTPVRIHLVRQGGPNAADPKAETDMLPEPKLINADPSKRDYDVELTFKPEKKSPEKSERFDLLVRAEPIGDELTLADNASTVVSTTVMDAKVNVLYVEGYPRWEFRYLKNELIREKSVNVSTILLSAESDFAQEGDPEEKDASGKVIFPGPLKNFPETEEELAKFGVILIGDVEPTYFSPTQMRMIANFVRKGGGVGFLAGWMYNPSGYRDTPLEPLLPVIPEAPASLDGWRMPHNPASVTVSNEGFRMMMTAAGRDSALFRFFDDPDENARQMNENPPMYWYMPVIGLKGSAEVLAVHPTKSMGGQPAPLLVTGRYGAGRTLFSAVTDTWRWRRYKGEPLYQSYWLQVCRLLYREKAIGQSHQVELATDMTTVEVGKPLRITVNIKDPTLVNVAPQQITVEVFDPQGKALEPVTLSRAGNNVDSYQGVATIGQVGAVKLAVKAGAFPVDIAPLEVKIKGPDREFADVTSDTTALGVMADRTEGKVLKLTDAGELARLITDKSRLDMTTTSEELWNHPIALILVVILLATEWLIRKSAGLI